MVEVAKAALPSRPPDKLVSVSCSFRKSPQETEGKCRREKAQAKETFPGVIDTYLKPNVLKKPSA